MNICIIGSSSGIGLATVKALKGHKIIKGSRRGKRYIDVSSEESIKSYFNKIESIDALVYCPGFVQPSNVKETESYIWNQTINVNLTGCFLVTKYALPKLKKDGYIINIASTSGLSSRPGWAAYSAAKAGVIAFSKSLADEIEQKVFILCPGRTATPLRKILAPKEDQSKIMQPEEVSNVIKQIIEGQLDSMSGEPIILRKRSNHA